jgi:hypothetical protein
VKVQGEKRRTGQSGCVTANIASANWLRKSVRFRGAIYGGDKQHRISWTPPSAILIGPLRDCMMQGLQTTPISPPSVSSPPRAGFSGRWRQCGGLRTPRAKNLDSVGFPITLMTLGAVPEPVALHAAHQDDRERPDRFVLAFRRRQRILAFSRSRTLINFLQMVSCDDAHVAPGGREWEPSTPS